MDLILASSSPYRRELLTRLKVPFETRVPAIDESPLDGETASLLALRLASEKARAVARPGSVIIGSDQVASFEDRLMGKPGNHATALEQLKAFQGRDVVFYTSVSVRLDDQEWKHLDRTVVSFRQLSVAQLDRYLSLEAPYDCAGGFKCEGLGISLFESIRSEDPTALIGLPLIWLSGVLLELGLVLNDEVSAGASEGD